MKKFICLSVCYCAFALAAQVPIPENVKAQFAGTCENESINYNGQTLTARCRDNNQDLVSTSIDVVINNNSVIRNCNGKFCLGRCVGPQNSCPQRDLANLQQQLQKQLASLQHQLATTKDNLTKIRLNLQILNLQNQIYPNSMLTNSTITLNTIKDLIPTPVPANLQEFSNQVDQALQLTSQMTPQSGQQQMQQPELRDILNHLLRSSNRLR